MGTGIYAITAPLAAGAAAIAVAAAPIALAAPSEQQCLALHCLAVEAPTVSPGRGNVQIFTSPKAMPAGCVQQSGVRVGLMKDAGVS